MAEMAMPEIEIKNSDPLAMAMAMQRGGGDGLFGGGGLVGGLVLGALLRNGSLLGGDAGGQSQANMSLMAGIGDIKQAVAVGTTQMEASQTAQTAQLSGQLASVAAALTGTIGGVKEAVNAVGVLTMQGTNQVERAIAADGEKTRALIVQQYEATLNRQLTEANAALVELRSESRMRDNSINVTQQVNQMQQQQQWTGLLSNLLGEMQNIRATNQAINIGAGTLSASPINTNSNTRVN